MRCNKRVLAGILNIGLISTGVLHASAAAISVSSLYGNWIGTGTVQTSPVPIEITTSGISDYPTTPSDFNPQTEAFTFAPSSQFAFGFAIDTQALPPGLVLLPQVQTGATASGNTFTWDTTSDLSLSDGTTLGVVGNVYTATVTLDPANSDLLLMTGTNTETFLLDKLPDDASGHYVVADNLDFSVTMAAPSGSGSSGSGGSSGASAVPLPASAWSSLTMLGGLGCVQYLRSRRRNQFVN